MLVAGCQNKGFGRKKVCFRKGKQTFAGEVVE